MGESWFGSEAVQRDECENGLTFQGRSTGQAHWGGRDVSLRAAPWKSKTLNLRVTWSDPGTQAQEREIYTSNNMAVEPQQHTTTKAHRQSLNDRFKNENCYVIEMG